MFVISCIIPGPWFLMRIGTIIALLITFPADAAPVEHGVKNRM
jgi:hypothetical protein